MKKKRGTQKTMIIGIRMGERNQNNAHPADELGSPAKLKGPQEKGDRSLRSAQRVSRNSKAGS